MADQAEEGIGADAAPAVGLALSGSKSSTYVLRWALAKFAKDKPAPAAFRLIHVLTPVLAVPTPRTRSTTPHIPLIPVSLLAPASVSFAAYYVFVFMSLCVCVNLASVGNYIPIDKAHTVIADDYVKRVELAAQQMLAHCKNICDENEVV